MLARLEVFPTHVGMDRGGYAGGDYASSIPHARGDGPPTTGRFQGVSRYSPRTWGWTYGIGYNYLVDCVFPTHVGMDRGRVARLEAPGGIPHARGDGPAKKSAIGWRSRYSPRTWGWTEAGIHCGGLRGVFPTHVGMDRVRPNPLSRTPRIPHARGDGPIRVRSCFTLTSYSPRTWGWTAARIADRKRSYVFPTHVGMDRRMWKSPRARWGIPHARGDGPPAQSWRSSAFSYSPRTWGWTVSYAVLVGCHCVFPTHVGMDREVRRMSELRKCIPHARGDGPRAIHSQIRPGTYSPRTWGWTDEVFDAIGRFFVFPTHVGMDRMRWRVIGSRWCIPHARGDGPCTLRRPNMLSEYSPRTWGWTVSSADADESGIVFPTHVGMDRRSRDSPHSRCGIPHARGDGPL